ncbi:hypothetical protein PYCCODRAFT_1422858 [Trametes coccinea BRFM310]|uniref:Uncharacterized protein n=1 Tax=Trametes coccinea (strain BRFM310) TaxID=1353009 RepID=A0A1Y2IZT9_TRAC3|nr:hypothetical protein PYCCODRAFT_1422858 [Trametes coccinea BRFM310]
MSSHTVIVDDSDTSRINYVDISLGPYRGQGWTTRSGSSLDPKEGPIYDSTLHLTGIEDVSLEFPFKGTRVSVYGSVWPPSASWAPLTISAYSVVGWDYGGHLSMQPYQAPNISEPVNNVNFFTSDDMPYDSYTLVINVTSASASSPYYLDYIAVEVPGPAPSSSSAPATSTATSPSPTLSPSHAPSASQITSTSHSLPDSSAHTSSPLQALTSTFPTNSASLSNAMSNSSLTPSPVSSAASITSLASSGSSSLSSLTSVTGTSTALPPLAEFSRSSSVPVGAIVGAALGSITALTLVVLLVIFVCMRKRGLRSREFNYGTRGQQDFPPSTTPYVSPASPNSMQESSFSTPFSIAGASRSLDSPSPIPSPPNTPPALRTFPSRKALAAAAEFRPLSDAVNSMGSMSSC